MPSETSAAFLRLHPASLLFIVGSLAWSFLFPAIAVFVFAARSGSYELWIALFFFPALIGALVKYWSFRYRLEDDELIVREGIIFRNERHIPFSRIQNIDRIQNPLHRVFGVAEIRLETAAGGKPEAVLRVMSLTAYERMRSRVFADRRSVAPAPVAPAPVASAPVAPANPTESGHLLLAMDSREVLLFGLISNKGMVVVAAAMGLLWQANVLDGWWEDLSPRSFRVVGDKFPGDDIAGMVLLALGGILAFVILMRVLSVVWAVVKLHGFSLRRSGDDLRAEYGLWNRVSKTIPRHRIQVLSTREGFLHRLLGRKAVQVETAGGVNDEDGTGSDRLWLAPLVRRERVADLLCEALPEVQLIDLAWQSISPRAQFRIFRIWLLWLTLLTIPATFGLGPLGLLPIALLTLLAYQHSRLYVKHTGYALVPGALVFRSGWWIRRVSVARFAKIQSVHLTQSPFDRRRRMAGVSLDTAGATQIGHGIDISLLDTQVARSLLDRLSLEAARTTFHW